MTHNNLFEHIPSNFNKSKEGLLIHYKVLENCDDIDDAFYADLCGQQLKAIPKIDKAYCNDWYGKHRTDPYGFISDSISEDEEDI